MYGRGTQQIRFGPQVTPPIMKRILIANLVVFLVQKILEGQTIVLPGGVPDSLVNGLAGLRPYLVFQHGYLWQPFTYMWLHDTHGLMHIVMNMYMLWMFGSDVALAWGPRRFLRFYLVCGVGTGFIIALWPYLMVGFGLLHPAHLAQSVVGASGAVYAVLLAFAIIWRDRMITLILPPVSFRAFWLIPILFVTTVLFSDARVSQVGHLGGLAMGWLYLRRSGMVPGGMPTLRTLRRRWHHHRMRRKLHAVRDEQRRRRRDDRWLH